MKIGILDSGIGGLTVLKECLKQIPQHEYLYFADSKHAPYGVKSKDEVLALTKVVVDFLIAEGAELLVIACNTATSAAADQLRKSYDLPIIGMEPAIKPALATGGRVLVTATELTLKEGKFLELIKKLDAEEVVDLCPLQKLVEFAEAGRFSDAETLPYLEEVFADFDLTLYRSVVLGCTHFPLFKAAFEKVLPEGVSIIDGSVGTVNRVKEFLATNSEESSVRLFLSGEPLEAGEDFERIWSILGEV